MDYKQKHTYCFSRFSMKEKWNMIESVMSNEVFEGSNIPNELLWSNKKYYKDLVYSPVSTYWQIVYMVPVFRMNNDGSVRVLLYKYICKNLHHKLETYVISYHDVLLVIL